MELLFVIVSCVMLAVGLGVFASAMVARRDHGRVGVARQAIGIVLMAVPMAIMGMLWVIDSMPNPFPGP